MKNRYPIIFCHGMAHKSLFKIYRPFGRIVKYLKKEDFDVYIANHDGFGAIETNAVQIKKYIEQILKKTGAKKVHIIAHSKGGLDVRYLIYKYNMGNVICSLTTISTPHRGSIMASKMLKLPIKFARFICFWINLFYRFIGDKKPNALTLNKQLSKEYLDEFNNVVIDDNNVYYQSYSCRVKKMSKDIIMGVPNEIYKHWEDDENDGLVSVSSSIWGEYKGDALDESISHTEIVGFSKSKEKRERIYEFYAKLCDELIDRE